MSVLSAAADEAPPSGQSDSMEALQLEEPSLADTEKPQTGLADAQLPLGPASVGEGTLTGAQAEEGKTEERRSRDVPCCEMAHVGLWYSLATSCNTEAHEGVHHCLPKRVTFAGLSRCGRADRALEPQQEDSAAPQDSDLTPASDATQPYAGALQAFADAMQMLSAAEAAKAAQILAAEVEILFGDICRRNSARVPNEALCDTAIA